MQKDIHPSYTATEVRDLLSSAGFFVERWSYALTTLFPLALAQRLAERLLPGEVVDIEREVELGGPLQAQVVGAPLQQRDADRVLGRAFKLVEPEQVPGGRAADILAQRLRRPRS